MQPDLADLGMAAWLPNPHWRSPQLAIQVLTTTSSHIDVFSISSPLSHYCERLTRNNTLLLVSAMVLEALHPDPSEGDIVSEPHGSETLGKQGDTTTPLSPPQAETTVYDTRLAGMANPIPNFASIYRYSPLSANSIRLLRLQPHSDEHAPIQCQLFEYPLSDSRRGTHLYEALSYVWGSEEKPRRVSTNEGDLYVTKNLHAALLRLRDRSFERIIWADAICINQDDIEERNYQVQAMAKIYARASRVIVWLEEATSSPPGDSEVSDNVCRALEEISSAAGGQLAKFSDEEAIHTLLRQSWFERIWVWYQTANRIDRYLLM